MKKLFTTLLLMLGFGLGMFAQDTIRSVVISEIIWNRYNSQYFELTNMGSEPVDLSNLMYASISDAEDFTKVGDEWFLTNSRPSDARSFYPKGILQPGESYLVMAVRDPYYIMDDLGYNIRPYHSLSMLERADSVVHFPDWGTQDKLYPVIPEYEMWGFDSVSANNQVMYMNEDRAAGLFWISGDTSTVLVDQAFLEIDPATSSVSGDYQTVAGIYRPETEHIFVRKFSIKEGNTDWTTAAGSDAASSEWMLIPGRGDWDVLARMTEGNHDNFSIDVSSEVATIDEDNSKITVPWGTQKYDSVINVLTLGQGMSWLYEENSSFEDSLSTIVRNGDYLTLYACGNDLQTKVYELEVTDPSGDEVNIYPKHSINYPDPEEGETISLVGGVAYNVFYSDAVMDSIRNVPFATKIDTMLNLLDIPPGATYEIIFASGEVSNEVSLGDIFRVTGSDGSTTNDYFIKVEEYESSDNLNLRAITWPDNPYPFLEGWKDDTIPGFVNSGLSYQITLPPDAKAVPALLAETEDLNAKLKVNRAVSLSGGVNERTTTFIITSESDTLTREVKVLFEVQNPYKQKYIGEPIISEIFPNFQDYGAIEIYNPTDELIDLSRYMIVHGKYQSVFSDAIAAWSDVDSSGHWLNRYNRYVPGYKWQAYDQWQFAPRMLELDSEIDPYLDPGQTLVIGKLGKTYKSYQDILEVKLDVTFNDNDPIFEGAWLNPWNEPTNGNNSVAYQQPPTGGQSSRGNYWLVKMKDDKVADSLHQALKAVTDPEDFEVVDAFGSVLAGKWLVDGLTYESGDLLRREPHVFKGVTGLDEGLEDQWIQYDLIQTYDRTEMVSGFKQHTIDPISVHLSTVTSLVYKVPTGFEGSLLIEGVGNGETVNAFIANLIKANDEQVLEVYNSADGSVRAGSEAVAADDSLVVISSNGENRTKYDISTVPLDGDAVLVPVDGSGITVNVSGSTGTVGGFLYGATLRSVVENVTVPAKAIMNVIDADDELISLQRNNNDSVYVDVVATESHFFEVVAENGDVILYTLAPESSASDAYVLSDVYGVAEDPVKVISKMIPGTAVPSFMTNIYPVKGATMKVVTITGQERSIGNLSIDDVLEVTSEDGSLTVSYELFFYGEELYAYVTSESFSIDQDNKVITVDEGTTVESLVGGLVAAPSAVMEVQDASGSEKTTGELVSTDVVVVTSGDGATVVIYTLNVLVSVNTAMHGDIMIYPNPVDQTLFVENLPDDSKVRISDITGRSRKIVDASEVNGSIDLSGLQGGIYFFIVEKQGENLEAFKLVVR
jgi:hypothetical protein